MISIYGKNSIYGLFLPFQSIRTVWQAHFHIIRYSLFQVIVFVIQKFVVFVFILSIFIAAFRWQPLCYKQSPDFRQKFQKKTFFSADTYEKYIVRTDYCIAHHNDKTFILPACKYQIILLGNVEELLKKLNTRGLSVYTIQVSIKWKSYCKEWTSVW